MIYQSVCTSFKLELFSGTHDFTTDTFKLALYDADADLDETTTAYSATNEVSGTNYTAGGATLTANTPAASGTTAVADFQDVTFSTLTVSGIRAGLIYNASKSNKAVAVLDFGRTFNKTAADLTVTFPTPDSVSGLLRIK